MIITHTKYIYINLLIGPWSLICIKKTATSALKTYFNQVIPYNLIDQSVPPRVCKYFQVQGNFVINAQLLPRLSPPFRNNTFWVGLLLGPGPWITWHMGGASIISSVQRQQASLSSSWFTCDVSKNRSSNQQRLDDRAYSSLFQTCGRTPY